MTQSFQISTVSLHASTLCFIMHLPQINLSLQHHHHHPWDPTQHEQDHHSGQWYPTLHHWLYIPHSQLGLGYLWHQQYQDHLLCCRDGCQGLWDRLVLDLWSCSFGLQQGLLVFEVQHGYWNKQRWWGRDAQANHRMSLAQAVVCSSAYVWIDLLAWHTGHLHHEHWWEIK